MLQKYDSKGNEILEEYFGLDGKPTLSRDGYAKYVASFLEKEILSLAVKLVTDEHLKELQTQTYSERDRLSMAHDEYQRSNGKITLDQFIGKLLRGEIINKK